MKYLYLVRHAKSSWDDASLSDIERPLNKRGKKDAPFMGKLLNKMKISPELLITSPAKRALTTARIFAEEIDYPDKKIIIDERIYGASPGEIIKIISELDEQNIIMVFGHNPTFTSVANFLSVSNIDNLPTCSVTGIEFPVDNWPQIEEHKGKIILFEYPKKYFSEK